MSQMTALFAGNGPEWQARHVPVPRPGPSQILVRARAVSINNADIAMLADDATRGGAGGSRAGYEFAGEIVALGPGVDTVQVGDEVLGTAPESFAEYVIADHRHVFPTPEGVGYEEASALPTGLLTEHGALMLADFQSGGTVLITAATSNIGLIGIQVARALGAGMVIATSRAADKTDLLEGTGADFVIITAAQDLTDAVLNATSQVGVDVVLDHVGGQTLADCLTATTVGGQIISIGRLGQAESTINLGTLAARQIRIRGVSFNFSQAEQLGQVVAAASELLPAVADGRIRPVIDTVFSFQDHSKAAARARSGDAVGKIVLTLA